MMGKRFSITGVLAVFTAIGCLTGCRPATNDDDEGDDAKVVTTVAAVHPVIGPIESKVQVNAVSDFLIKSTVRSTINGYLTSVNAKPGDAVHKGEVLFTLETREAHNLGNTLHHLDSTLNFHGTISIRSPYDGYVKSVNFQVGEYAQEGDALASVADSRSLVFLLDLPFELTPIIRRDQMVTMHLPDGRNLNGKLMNALPAVDSASQTQRFIIRLSTPVTLPANLIATINLIRESHRHAVLLPKEAVLADEMQNRFWVMKADDSIAVQIDIKKGIETPDTVEIDSPRLETTDLILTSGNYGLPDSARIILRSRPQP